MINLFVGDCKEYLADEAKKFDTTAFLVDSNNFEDFLRGCENITAYTSFADLPKISKTRAPIFEVLDKADNIYYRPPIKWSDYSEEFSIENQQQITEYFLYLINQKKYNVNGLDLNRYIQTPYLKLKSQRISDLPQLWIAGCSITAGDGVMPEEKFSTQIACDFNNKFSDLSKPSSSIEFSSDQILRSDIRSGDIIVWGLTSEYRAVYWDRVGQDAQSINVSTFNYKKTNRADDIVDETRLYKSVVVFNQVSNFCKKIGAKLIGVPIICGEALQLLLHNHPDYYQLPYQPCPIDYGSDNIHPGPKQHQWYAEQIKKIIKGLTA